MLISPRNTLNTCGNSSRLVRRKSRPNRVRRGSLRILKRGPLASLSSISVGISSSAPWRIERNLYAVNGLPRRPIRVCIKMIGPAESSRITKAITSISQPMHNNAKMLIVRSSMRLTTESTVPMRASRMPINGMPPTSSITTRLSESWNKSGTTLATAPNCWLTFIIRTILSRAVQGRVMITSSIAYSRNKPGKLCVVPNALKRPMSVRALSGSSSTKPIT